MPTLEPQMLPKYCPKTGRRIDSRPRAKLPVLLLTVAGFASLIWYVLRVGPKPSRAAYPCQRVAAPLAWSFLAYLGGSTAFLLTLRKSTRLFTQTRFAFAGLCLLSGGGLAAFGLYHSASSASAESTGTFRPTDAPNAPIGTARGIFPGRVAWGHDPKATSWDGRNNWRDDQYNDQAAISNLLARSVEGVGGKPTVREAWDAIFRNFNQAKGKGSVGYRTGEKIAIKINLNNWGDGNRVDASPHLAYALLEELVSEVGVSQGDIVLYDAQRNSGIEPVRDHCASRFPNVKYNDWGGWVGNSIKHNHSTASGASSNLPRCVVEAEYLINSAILKRHGRPTDNYSNPDGQTAITVCGKNHFGTSGNPGALHYAVRDWNEPFGNYNPLVDFLGSKHIGGKTVLYIVDALYAGNLHDAVPSKWKLAPFSNDWPSSVLASQDGVAIDSVALDFLRAEWPLPANADNFLHEAALAFNPPSRVQYRPDGVALTTSLGVHEHWNNSSDKQYSRNLGTGQGIELYRVKLQGEVTQVPDAGVDASPGAPGGATPVSPNRDAGDSWDAGATGAPRAADAAQNGDGNVAAGGGASETPPPGTDDSPTSGVGCSACPARSPATSEAGALAFLAAGCMARRIRRRRLVAPRLTPRRGGIWG